MQKINVMICAFHAVGGWRVKHMATAISDKVQTITLAGKKLLQIPVIGAAKAGRFCNPKRLALEYVRAKATGVQPSSPVNQVIASAKPVQMPFEENLRAVAAEVARIWGIGPYNKQMKGDCHGV